MTVIAKRSDSDLFIKLVPISLSNSNKKVGLMRAFELMLIYLKFTVCYDLKLSHVHTARPISE
jgi:hypothetical protein